MLAGGEIFQPSRRVSSVKTRWSITGFTPLRAMASTRRCSEARLPAVTPSIRVSCMATMGTFSSALAPVTTPTMAIVPPRAIERIVCFSVSAPPISTATSMPAPRVAFCTEAPQAESSR
jgi:hypothetical protein